MAIWQDANGALYDDMDGEALSHPSWPQHVTQITQAEADAIINAHIAAVQAAQAKLPNPPAFGEAIKAALGGILAANALALAYPLFFGSVQGLAWEDVQAMLVDAEAKAVITASQYEAIKAAAAQFNIPVTL